MKDTRTKKKNGVLPILLLIGLLLVLAVQILLRMAWVPDTVQPDLTPVPAESSAPVVQPPASTPEAVESQEPEETRPETDPDLGKLQITEVMAKNRSWLPTADGCFYDWIEIQNVSGETVDLTGWSLVNRKTGTEETSSTVSADGKKWTFSEGSLAAGERMLVYASGLDSCEGGVFHTDFSLSTQETLELLSPWDFTECTVEIPELAADASLAWNDAGTYEVCAWPTPGVENTLAAYDRLQAEAEITGPLVINEVVGGNIDSAECNTGTVDWLEIKNISDTAVALQSYRLSDDSTDFALWQLPEMTLEPGETVVFFCDGDEASTTSTYIHTNFSIDAVSETLYLSTAEGLVDVLSVHDVPVGGSVGRLDGENGMFYFTTPTPQADNTNGYRRVAARPTAVDGDGVFNGVDTTTGMAVELSAAGTIYYTTDGTDPTTDSPVYDAPIVLTETTIVRAIAVEDGLAPSREAVLSFIINENHTLPVLSLVADSYSAFRNMYSQGLKYSPVPGSLSLYEEDGSFTNACDIRVKGWTSRELPKKSLGVEFSGKYGDGTLNYDVFDTGITNYENLSIRAGQDYTFSVIRNELFQELCMEATDAVPTQHSKYCVLYINGNYWGLYCLKEDINKSYYANLTGTKKSQVQQFASPVNDSSYAVYQEVFQWAKDHDLSTAEDYEYFCSNIFDIDNLIDWIILEGYSANSDVNGNMRYFKTEGGKWQIVYYDLDWAWYYKSNCFANTLEPSKDIQIYMLIKRLKTNEAFCEKLARRAKELLDTTLSDEHVLAKIDELVAIVEPEMEREQERWDLSMSGWKSRVQELRDWITEKDWDSYCLKMVMGLLAVSKELRAELTA